MRVANYAISYDKRTVSEYRTDLCLRNCEFVVSEATRRRVLRIKRRKVCAWIEGELCEGKCESAKGLDVTFNPFRGERFTIRGTDNQVGKAEHVSLTIANGKPITRARGVRR